MSPEMEQKMRQLRELETQLRPVFVFLCCVINGLVFRLPCNSLSRRRLRDAVWWHSAATTRSFPFSRMHDALRDKRLERQQQQQEAEVEAGATSSGTAPTAGARRPDASESSSMLWIGTAVAAVSLAGIAALQLPTFDVSNWRTSQSCDGPGEQRGVF